MFPPPKAKKVPLMPEWLLPATQVDYPFTPQQLLFRLSMAAVFGACVAILFRLSHGRQRTDATVLTATLVLLSILIAMVSMVIGDSVARAFSLVGALSIVRFRTVVEDTRDTAFVIFAVIVGMAAGAGLLLVPAVGIPLAGAAAIFMNRADSGNGRNGGSRASNAVPNESQLTVRLGLGRDPEQFLGSILTRHLESFRLLGVETARQGAALNLSYGVRLRSNAVIHALVAELNQVEGVQSVELRV